MTDKNIRLTNQYIAHIAFQRTETKLEPKKDEQPKTNIQVNSQIQHISDNQYYTAIIIELKLTLEAGTIFNVALKHVGIFEITNSEKLSNKEKEEIVNIDCLKILFPYASRAISDVTKDGGLQPAILSEIDFHKLHEEKKKQENNVANEKKILN